MVPPPSYRRFPLPQRLTQEALLPPHHLSHEQRAAELRTLGWTREPQSLPPPGLASWAWCPVTLSPDVCPVSSPQ